MSAAHLLATALAALLLMLGGTAALYWLTLRYAAEVKLPALQQLVAAAQQAEAERERVFVQQNLNSMAMKLGEMQAQLTRLDAVGGNEREWAQEVAKDLRQRSPLSLKITHRHIRESAARDLRQTLIVDYRLACRILDANGDFYEGARAALIDKDRAPKWAPARLEEVSEAIVDSYFAPMGADELVLPTREEMQAARA